MDLSKPTLGSTPEAAREAPSAHEVTTSLAIDLADLSTWTAEIETGVVTGTPRLQEWFAMASPSAPARDWIEKLHPDDRSPVAAAFAEALSGKAPYDAEFRVCMGPTERWVRSRGQIAVSSDGRRVLVGVAEDITAKRELQARQDAQRDELETLYERLRLATQAAEVGLWDVDVIADTLFWPPSVKAMFGISAGVPVSMADFYAGLHPEDRDRVSDAFAAALHPERKALYDVEYRTVGKEDGLIRWVAAKGRGIFDSTNRCVRVIGTAIDVTARKTVEARMASDLKALTRLHALSSRLLEPGGLSPLLQEVMDTAVEIVNAQRGTLQLLQGDALRIVAHHGHQRPFLEFFAEADQKTSVCGEALSRGERVVVPDVEMSALFAGTSSLPVLRAAGVRAVQSTPMINRRGMLIGILTTHWASSYSPDEHDLWRIDLLVRQAAELIESATAAEALRASEERLREADRRKDQFLATLSHELRNPLAPIRTAAQLLGNKQLDDEKAAWTRQVIQRQVAHMTHLLDDLLDVARITQGKITLQQENVNLRSVLDVALDAARPLIERKHHRISVTLPPHELTVYGDPVRLSQIFANLLTNAAKYTDAPGNIELAARDDGEGLVIEVRDDGIGIDPAAVPTLFDLFVQIPHGVTHAEGGLGIGLALVKGLLALHQGSIGIASEGLGRGSTFTVRLPRAATSTKPASADPTPRPTSQQRILIADDNRDAAASLALLLELNGHQVRVAYDAQSTLSIAAAFHPDVALLDIGMPGFNGYELARAIRKEPWSGTMTLVAITGFGQAEDQVRTREAGFDLHLIKPVDPATIELLLDGHHPPSKISVDSTAVRKVLQLPKRGG